VINADFDFEVKKMQKDCADYLDSVTFFSVLSESLFERGIKVEIEHDFNVTGKTNSPVNPDFAIIENNGIIDILEHKASMSSPRNALSEIRKAHSNYSRLDYNGSPCTPKITILYPLNDKDVIDEIRGETPPEISLCSFDSKSDDGIITFNLEGDICCKKAKELINGNSIRFRATKYSNYKYIRHNAPTVYNAIIVWGLLYSFLDVRSARTNQQEVSRKVLIERGENYYQPWIRNNKQIRTDRINDGLQFLAKIKFIKVIDGDTILVLLNRGTKAGDLTDYFIRKYVEDKLQQTQRKSKRYKKGEKVLEEEPSLDQWL
jgi:hypothetical protein